MAEIVQPTKVILRTARINGVDFIEQRGDKVFENFTVHSLRVYEDICKSYFTGQLVIEDQLNATDPYLLPGVDVVLSWSSIPNSKTYTERFRVYSIDSKPKNNDLYAGMIITIALIGQEYYNDTQNTVMQNFSNLPATVAATQIHNQYLGVNGGLIPSPSKGMIGLQEHPHQVMNMKPIKAIHDLLDKAVSLTVDTSAFTYFRNKPGYVIAPLEELLNTSPMAGNFIHKPAQGLNIGDVLFGYNNVIHFRPMAPANQDSARGAEIDSLLKTSSFFDAKTGNFLQQSGALKMANTLKALTNIGKNADLLKLSQALLGQAVKTQFGSRQMFNVINEDRQQRTVDKNGPGGYNVSEEAFLATLNYSKKYWMSVPMQSGIDVTVGRRVNVVYPVGSRRTAKTLFVARLIHELQFKIPGQRKYEPAQGVTELYVVEW